MVELLNMNLVVAHFLSLLAYYAFALLLPIAPMPVWFFLTGAGAYLFIIEYLKRKTTHAVGEIFYLQVLAMVMFISAVAVLIYNGDKLNLEALNPIASIGMLHACERINPRHVKYSLFAFLALVCIVMLLGIDIDESIIVIGQNGAMLHMLTLYAAYYFKTLHEEPSVTQRSVAWEKYCVVVIMFTVSVWSQSRAATVVALILLLSVVWLLAMRVQGRDRFVIFGATLIVIGFNCYTPILMGDRSYSGIDRLGFSSFVEARYVVWIDYFQTLNPVSILLGNRENNCHLILSNYTQEWCNVHNSYLRAHQVYGIFGVIVIFVIISSSFVRFVRAGEKYSSIVLILIIMRIMTDEHFFTHSNLFLFYFIYISASKISCPLVEGGK